MATREQQWRDFVASYDIEVPEQAVQDELEYIELGLRQGMMYDRLTGSAPHLFPQRELAEQAEELRAAALFEAKEPLVLKRIIAEQGLTASRAELEAEAAAMAERENSTVEMVKRFFGEDLALLERDVLERKARDWACGQA